MKKIELTEERKVETRRKSGGKIKLKKFGRKKLGKPRK